MIFQLLAVNMTARHFHKTVQIMVAGFKTLVWNTLRFNSVFVPEEPWLEWSLVNQKDLGSIPAQT